MYQYKDWLEQFYYEFLERERREPTQAEIDRAVEMSDAQFEALYEASLESEEL